MIESFIQGILLGWGAAVPIGPLNILIMSNAFHSYSRAFCVGLGAMTTDAVYLTLATFGALQLLNSPLIFKVIAFFGACFLIYMAFDTYKSATKTINANENIELSSHFGSFAKGCLLNITNPYIVIFWISMSTVIAGSGENFIYIFVGLVVGILIWIAIFPLIIYKSRNKLGEKVVKFLSYFSAIILLFFAVSLVFKVFVKGIS